MYSYGLAQSDGGDSTFPTLAAQTPVATKDYTTLNTVPSVTGVGGPLYGAFYPIKFSASASVASLTLRSIASYGATPALSFRLGIYEDNNGVPGALLADAGTVTWSSISAGATVVKTFASPVTLSANTQYWVAFGSNLASGAPSMMTTVGTNKPFVDLGMAGEVGASGYYFSHNGANALPDPAPAVPFPAYGSARVWVRLS